jgi:hypothetical protein
MLSSPQAQVLAELISLALRQEPVREVFVRFLAEVAPMLPAINVERGEDLLTKREVAEMLRCSERTVSTYMRRWGLRHEPKRSGRVMFKRADVFRWAQDNGKSIAKPGGI